MSTHQAQRTRRREQRENTRREILAAAERFLRERPYRELSVEEMMADTGLTRTSFYRHFDDLASLVLAVLQDVGNELYEVAQRWVRSSSNGELAAREGLEGIVDFFARHGPLLRAIAEAAHHDDEIERVYGGYLKMFDELVERALSELLAAGKVSGLDAHETARALNHMNERYLLDSFGRKPAADRERVLETLTTIWRRVLYGQQTADGH
jgi:AcrR family transcriptional regulator